MRIIITGSNGVLGRKMVQYCIANRLTFIATSKGLNRNPNCPDYLYLSMDICNKLEINQVFDTLYPTHVFHAAAISDLDFCEKYPDLCHQVNVEGTALLFHACQQFEAHFKMISWDMTKNLDSEYSKSKVIAQKNLESSDYKNWSVANLEQDSEIKFLFKFY
jgi:dTDP-4-dehydrorhamnose reductase